MNEQDSISVAEVLEDYLPVTDVQEENLPVAEAQDSSLPLYYRENFFSRDTVFYTEQTGNQYGIAGDPIPYTVRGDNLLTSLLLICFIFLVISISNARNFITKQAKNIFFIPRNNNNISETSAEFRFQFTLVVVTCLVLAISTYQYTIFYVSDTFVVSNNLTLIGIFFAVFLAYFLLKVLFYNIVNTIFFEPQLNRQWQKKYLFIIAAEGVLIFPAMMLLVYFDLSPKKAVYYFIFILFLLKILTIYNYWNIFFSQKGGFLQTFLYFCTLEIVPLVNLVGGTLILIDNLKFNY